MYIYLYVYSTMLWKTPLYIHICIYIYMYTRRCYERPLFTFLPFVSTFEYLYVLFNWWVYVYIHINIYTYECIFIWVFIYMYVPDDATIDSLVLLCRSWILSKKCVCFSMYAYVYIDTYTYEYRSIT